MTTCPTSGALVPTGHRTPEIKLGEGTSARSFRCPTCSQVHSWQEADAEVEKTISLAAFRSAAA